jgi:hypothetical protein
MRWLIPTIALALAACAPESDHPGRIEASQSVACVATLTFESENARTAFLLENADRIVARAATRQFFFTSNSASPSIEIASEYESCPVEGLDRDLDLVGQFARDQSVVSTARVSERLQHALTQSLSGTDRDSHQCVIRMDQLHWDDYGGLSVRLQFSGLRMPNLQMANDVLYVAAEETCVMTSRFARAAMANLHGRSTDLVVCESSSFRECGYPNEFWSGPTP